MTLRRICDKNLVYDVLSAIPKQAAARIVWAGFTHRLAAWRLTPRSARERLGLL
jgi:hypothetical protein